MSDDDSASKEFDATPRKLEKARSEGNVPIGQDVLTVAVYFGFLVATAAFGSDALPDIGANLAAWLSAGLRAPVDDGQLMFSLLATLSPFFALPFLAVIAAAAAQNALLFSPKRLQPKLDKISPVKGAKKKFGASGLFEFAKSFVKLVIFSALLAWVAILRLPDIVLLLHVEGRQAVPVLLRLCFDFLFAAAVCVGAIAVVDLLWQRASHLRRNRMSRKEMTDESKDSEGDPHLKQARRRRAQEIAMNQMMADVPKADVVITNPTHYAVALRWARTPGSAPVCLAKGVDEVAARIRAVARDAKVPVFEDPPSARALFATVDIGSEIQPEHYRAVAAAIRFSDRIRQVS